MQYRAYIMSAKLQTEIALRNVLRYHFALFSSAMFSEFKGKFPSC